MKLRTLLSAVAAPFRAARSLRRENEKLRYQLRLKTAWGERYRTRHDQVAKDLSAERVNVIKLLSVRNAADVLVTEWARDDGTDPNGFVHQAEKHLSDVVQALRGESL